MARTHARETDAIRRRPAGPRAAGSTLHVSFSGGEARGYAHVGTLQAIERLGLPIREVSGTSIGAFMAALVAAGFTADRIARLAGAFRRRDFLRYGWPERRLLAHWLRPRARREPPGWWSVAPARRTLDRLLRGARFRDLPVPCAIQATDLTHGRLVYFSQAATPDVPVALAVSASMALPGLMAPVPWDGRALADGGAHVRLARVPIAADRIVVSDVSSHRDGPTPVTSLPGALLAYLRARERDARPPASLDGRPVTVLSHAAVVERLPAFRHPHPAVVGRVIAEACAVALLALVEPGAEGAADA